MTYEEIISEVEDGAKFAVNFTKRTIRLHGKVVDLSNCETPPMKDSPLMTQIECLYELYKHSVPSERSESHRKCYFKALPEKSLTDVDMMFGEQREVARCRLELFILLVIADGRLTWQEEWGSWFYQSTKDKDFIILRDWVEPRKEVDNGL